ncbi:MAG: hypothetical protein ACPGN3_02475 [Opitutales bacterium]
MQYSPQHGFTRLIAFGVENPFPLHGELDPDSIYFKKGTGYDSQYYAQIALDPSMQDPEVQASLDAPSYRARRIMMPWLASMIGVENVSLVLNTFALINVVCWILFALWLARYVNDLPRMEAFTRWGVCMFSVGVLDSLRLALTDFPAACLVVLIVYYAEQQAKLKTWCLSIISVFTKETSVLALLALAPQSFDWKQWARYGVYCLTIALPFGLWLLYLSQHVTMNAQVSGNLHIPFEGMIKFARKCTSEITSGNINVHNIFGLIAIASGLTQALAVALSFKWNALWVRVAIPFALIFIVAGDKVWGSTMAPLRIVLPLTCLIAVFLPKGRFFYSIMALTALPSIHGVVRWIFNL